VTRIDRLARSTFDLFATVKRIVDAGGQFRSPAKPWANTATSTGRLNAILGGLADVERDLIRTRTGAGSGPSCSLLSGSDPVEAAASSSQTMDQEPVTSTR
jgi:Resolvase, N terminal domain